VCCRSVSGQGSLLGCRTALLEPGSGRVANGFKVSRDPDPTRLPRIRSGLVHRPTKFAGHHSRGARTGPSPAARSLNPTAPFCEENDQRPRPGRLPSPSLDSSPRFALRRPSNRLPRCLDFASTTDVSRHEHPPETSPLETQLPTRREQAEQARRRSTSRSASALVFPPSSRKTPDHLAVIQPPAVTCLTARHRLRVIRRSRCAGGPVAGLRARTWMVRRFRAM